MEHLTNGQIAAFIFILAFCFMLAIIGGVKQKRPTIEYNDWIKKVVDNCNSYGVSVRVFGDEPNASMLQAYYHQGYTPTEAIQEFKKETIDEQNEEVTT